MEYESYDLNDLYRRLPEYANSITEKRKYGKYNCPLCDSGARENGTPAFNLYNDNLKCHCHSCGFDGNIIGLYLAVNQMAETKENVAVAIRALGKSYGLIPQDGTAPVKAKTTQPRTEISRREHIYHNADGSIFGKKVIPKYSDGSKGGIWYLFNRTTQQFHTKSGLEGQKAPLYHANRLHQDTTSPTVIFVEGEKDVETIERIADGAEILATSTPNGANQTAWPDLYNADLSDREIIIITDNDASGEKYGHTVAFNLCKIAKSVRIIPTKAIWPDCPEKADISDAVKALGADETAQRLGDAIQKAEIYVPELDKLNQLSTNQTQKTFKAKKGYEFEKKAIRYVWYPYIPAGDYTVLMAAGGTGKTYFACGIAATISKGEALPVPPEYANKKVISKNRNVLIISAEDRGSDIWERLEKAGADVDCIDIMDKSLSNGLLFPKDGADTERIKNFEDIIEEYKPNLIIIDPWHAFCPPDVDVNRINHVRPVFQNISAICEKYDCGLILISHVNKKPQDNANNAALGSVDFVNASRSALTVISDSRNKNRRIVVHTKINHASYGQSVAFTITDNGFNWDGFEPNITKDTLEEANRAHRKPVEMVQETPDYSEIKDTLLEIITELVENGKETKIAYRQLENMYDSEEYRGLNSTKKRELIEQLANSEAFKSRGMTLIGYTTSCKFTDNITGKTGYGKGIVIRCMVTGHEMAAAMSKKK